MNRDTVIRIEIPIALYESVKSKVLNESKKSTTDNKKSTDKKDQKKIK
jgi:hypothetical protein